MYNPSLCFAPAGVDACAMWRMWIPHLNTPHSRYLFSEGTPDMNSMSECDILVVQRLMMEGNVEFLNIARAHGLKIIYDLDDNVWNLPASNPAAHFFHRSESVKGLLSCMEWADAITTSTQQLKAVVESKIYNIRNKATKRKIPVIHIDNAIDFKFFHKGILPKDEDKVVIGWGGSNTHEGDVGVVWKLLPMLLAKYKNVHLEFVGQLPPESVWHHPRVKVIPFCHISEYANRFATWNWDIVLAPLELHNFNRSKSAIKMLEAGAISASCLAQNISPYKNFCAKSKSLTWLLCNDFDWERKICRLIEDKGMRKDLGALAYYTTLVHYNADRTAQQWLDLSHQVMD